MLSVHDISTHAKIQVSLSSHMEMGADLRAVGLHGPSGLNASGREPWLPTCPKYGFTAPQA